MRPSLFFLATLLPAAALAAPAGYAAGEAFTYSFSVGPIEAGRARMAVGAPAPDDAHGRRIATVNGDAHSANFIALLVRLDDTYQLAFDADRLLPIAVTSDEKGLRVRHIESEVDGRRLKLSLARPGRTDLQRRTLPGIARDPVATLFWLRAQRLADGEQLAFLALDGASLYSAHAVVAGREAFTPKVGRPARAIRLDVQATRIDDAGRPMGMKDRHFHIYLSDDDLRVPYRVSGETDIGEARIELTSYAPGKPVVVQEPGRPRDEGRGRRPPPFVPHPASLVPTPRVNSGMVRGN